jgi:nitrogenase-stabilizing/protective protein
MTTEQFDEELQELASAEDFLDYFNVPYEAPVVHVNRLHILQRFHDYLAQDALPESEAPRREVYRRLLSRAYQDFVDSDALTEKVFKVFHEANSGSFIPVEELLSGTKKEN